MSRVWNNLGTSSKISHASQLVRAAMVTAHSHPLIDPVSLLGTPSHWGLIMSDLYTPLYMRPFARNPDSGTKQRTRAVYPARVSMPRAACGPYKRLKCYSNAPLALTLSRDPPLFQEKTKGTVLVIIPELSPTRNA